LVDVIVEERVIILFSFIIKDRGVPSSPRESGPAMLILQVALVNLVDDLLGIQEVLVAVSPTTEFLSPVSLWGLVGWDLADRFSFWLRALYLLLLLSKWGLLLLVRLEGFGFRKLSVLLVVHALKQPSSMWVLVPRFEGVVRTYTCIHGLLDHRLAKFVQT
jgi:hypothetical protein